MNPWIAFLCLSIGLSGIGWALYEQTKEGPITPHQHYVDGCSFVIEAGTRMPMAKCDCCGEYFDLRPFPWHFRKAGP